MVNSASQALAEFKSQRMGGLLSGTSSTVDAPNISMPGSDASSRLARSAPKRSSTAFMDNIRESGKRLQATALAGLQAKQNAITGVGSATRPGVSLKGALAGGGATGKGYKLPGATGKAQTGGPRGQYGLTVPAAAAFNQLAGAYKAAGQGNLTIVSGGRTTQEQAHLYALYKAGKGNLAAPPGQSLHESGIAADLGGAAHSMTKQHAWLQANAAQFKWYWVGQRFGEPWHWEYHPEYK